MSQRILDQINRVKNLKFTTLSIRYGNRLYERYYGLYDSPDYELIYNDLSEEEVKFAKDNGI